MPYKSDKVKIAGTKHDKRVKLTQDDRNAIIILIQKGYSQRKLASLFRVSRRLIQHIISPQPRTPAATRSKEYWTEAKRKYRTRKHELYISGKIRATRKKTASKIYTRKSRRDKD